MEVVALDDKVFVQIPVANGLVHVRNERPKGNGQVMIVNEFLALEKKLHDDLDFNFLAAGKAIVLRGVRQENVCHPLGKPAVSDFGQPKRLMNPRYGARSKRHPSRRKKTIPWTPIIPSQLSSHPPLPKTLSTASASLEACSRRSRRP